MASEVVPGPDCEGSAEAPAIDNDAQAGTTDMVTVGTTPITTSEMPTVIDDVALADAPAAGDSSADQEVTGAAITDILSGSTAPVEQADARANGAPAAMDESVAHQPAITAEQRKFLADRSVSLLVKVGKGELTVEEAIRQAEMLPERKTK